ncbi:MAG: hypothetical protein ISEC1_P1592 [Thiomicrorhabdus sp.]|nr:MAG: hypothetical protein ISEC1_P1592 [Thiomicrorhabdus sp.]
MKDAKSKSAPVVLTDKGTTENQRNKTLVIKYLTIPDWVIALKYCLEQSKKGLEVSNREYSRLPFGNHYFRNHFSKCGELTVLGIGYAKEWRTSPISKKRYKAYFILEDSFSKAESIIKRYYKTEK